MRRDLDVCKKMVTKGNKTNSEQNMLAIEEEEYADLEELGEGLESLEE